MEKFTKVTGVAAPLMRQNVDTDLVIRIERLVNNTGRQGLGPYCFEQIRFKPDGSENPDCVLNQEPYRGAPIILSADNFGCGSSREGAVWALAGMGVKAVIAPSYGDIFYNNCFQNGILPIKVSPEDLDKLMDDANRGANATLTVDLEKQEIRGPDGGMVKFEMDAFRKRCLLEGLDNIGLTLQSEKAIGEYEEKAQAARPWA
jgi:3-isopropylmalate/(R)-2-methylmalate dehydratase small subunit